MSKKAQLKQEKAFKQMMFDYWQEREEPKTRKEINKEFQKYKKLSDEQRHERREQYKEGAIIWRMREGKRTPEYEGGIIEEEEKVIIPKPGEKIVTEKAKFEEEERPIEFKYGDLKKEYMRLQKENEEIRKELRKMIKREKAQDKRINKLLARLER